MTDKDMTGKMQPESKRPEKIKVEVAYALADEQQIVELEVEQGTTVRQAILRSGISGYFHDLDIENSKVGIFGKLSKMDKQLRAGDRVEIYRPLIADPKEVRRQRAAEGKKMKKGAS